MSGNFVGQQIETIPQRRIMRIEDRGLIYDATLRPPSQRVTSFCELVRLDDGTLLCVFQVGPCKNDAASTIRLCRSDDEGHAWHDLPCCFETSYRGVPGSFSGGVIAEVELGRLMLAATWFDRSEPQRPLFDPESQGLLHGKILKAFSTDGGMTWTAWEEIATPGLSGCSLTGPLLAFSDGALGLALESYKVFDDPSPQHHAAWLFVSRDGGRSFPDRFLVAQDPRHHIYYWDQRLCVGPEPDELLVMFWTHDLREQKDLLVHLRRGSLCGSELKLSPIQQTSIPGQIAAPLYLPDGRLVALVVARAEPSTITLRQSFDGGESWPSDAALIVYTHDERALLSQGSTNIDYNAYWADMARWSFGHPTLRSLEADRLLAVYYAGPPDNMSVHWARVDVSASSLYYPQSEISNVER